MPTPTPDNHVPHSSSRESSLGRDGDLDDFAAAFARRRIRGPLRSQDDTDEGPAERARRAIAVGVTAFLAPRGGIGTAERQVLEPDRRFSSRGVFAVFDTWSGGWTALAVFAVLGNVLYGATLVLILPQWPLATSLVWLALAAGFAWPVLGMGLVALCRRHVLLMAHACLVALSWGTAVNLLVGLINLSLWAAGLTPSPVSVEGAARADANGFAPGPMLDLPFSVAGHLQIPLALGVNLACGLVGTNLVMLYALIVQLRVLGVAWWRPTLAWFLLLNGGVLAGWYVLSVVLHAVLENGSAAG